MSICIQNEACGTWAPLLPKQVYVCCGEKILLGGWLESNMRLLFSHVNTEAHCVAAASGLELQCPICTCADIGVLCIKYVMNGYV